MNITEVRTKKDARDFLQVARIVYKDDPDFVCPLDMSLEAIFNPKKNIFYSKGEATRWIMRDDQGKLIGRVAAFINRAKAFNYKQPTGGMGFFECIDDKNSAFALFDTARKWLEERGMEAMDGPVNFGENDNYWGLLVEGYMQPGYGMAYNPPYYVGFFEEYGFHPYFEQVTNHLDLTKQFPERFWKIAEWLLSKNKFTYEHFSFDNVEKYIKDFKTIYDEAWKFHENFTPINVEVVVRTMKDAKAVMDPELIWFAYHEGEPVAFEIMFPDLNEAIKPFNGKLCFFNKARLWWRIKKKVIKRARITIMGVVPKYQRYGVESGLFWHMDKVMKRKPQYKEIELSWVGDFNPKMRKLHESVGAAFAKKHITYRKHFNEVAAANDRATRISEDTKYQSSE